MKKYFNFLLFSLFFSCFALSSCKKGAEEEVIAEGGECSKETPCPSGFSCNVEKGVCLCENDEACGGGLICNSSGFCQEKDKCYSNEDCKLKQVCNIDTGFCVASVDCLFNHNCPIGTLCQSNKCNPGCKTDNDCPYKNLCMDNICKSGFCRKHTDCGYLEKCNPQIKKCQKVTGPHCKSCGGFAGCNQNFECISFMQEGTKKSICTQPCKTSEDCPSGFSCGGAVVPCDMGSFVCAQFNLVCKDFIMDRVSMEKKRICSDPNTGLPKEISKSCAPNSGFCK